jgi:hypothetical protein
MSISPIKSSARHRVRCDRHARMTGARVPGCPADSARPEFRRVDNPFYRPYVWLEIKGKPFRKFNQSYSFSFARAYVTD